MDIIVQVFDQGFDSIIIQIQISLNVMTTMVAVVRFAITLKEALNAHVEMAMYKIVMDIIVQVHIFYRGSYLMRFDIIKIQISLNVMKTMVAVVRYAPTLKEAMNVPVEMAMY